MKFTREDIDILKDWANQNVLDVFASLNFFPSNHGKYLKSQCPIPYHGGDADNINAFSWSFFNNRWGCWTHQCHKETKYDIIGFVQAMRECTFGAALWWLYNLKEKGFSTSLSKKVQHICNKQRFQRKLDKRKLEILMSDFYFKSRGISEELLKKHQVGYWQKEGTFLNKRAIVPLFDIDSNLVGYSARSLLSSDECTKLGVTKWIHAIDFVVNSDEMLDKSNILYNLDKCKDIVKFTKTIYLVEGPIDCWRLEMAGINNVVATLGLYVTMAQQNILLQLGVDKIIICYDNDINNAGQNAAERLRLQLGSMFDVEVKTPQGFKDYGEMSNVQIKETLNVL